MANAKPKKKPIKGATGFTGALLGTGAKSGAVARQSMKNIRDAAIKNANANPVTHRIDQATPSGRPKPKADRSAASKKGWATRRGK